MKRIRVTGINTDEAISLALKQLNITVDKLNYEVLQHSKKSSTIEAWATETKKNYNNQS